MCILINRISQNVALHGRPHLLTFALLSREGIPPWTTFLDLHDQLSFLHSLMRISMIAFTCPQTTRCPWIGPPVQYIYIYIYIYILLGLSFLQYPFEILLSCSLGRKEDFDITTITILLSHIISVHASTFLIAQHTLLTLQHPRRTFFNFYGSMFPTFYNAMWIQRLGILLELGWEFSHLSFTLIQILLEHLDRKSVV